MVIVVVVDEGGGRNEEDLFEKGKIVANRINYPATSRRWKLSKEEEKEKKISLPLSRDETCLDLSLPGWVVGDLISRAVVQKMIQAAITKRLPVLAGGQPFLPLSFRFHTPCVIIAHRLCPLPPWNGRTKHAENY